MMMNAISKKSRKNAITKMNTLTKIEKADLPAGQRDEQMLDPFLSADALRTSG